jgi:hypothetical protein
LRAATCVDPTFADAWYEGARRGAADRREHCRAARAGGPYDRFCSSSKSLKLSPLRARYGYAS